MESPSVRFSAMILITSIALMLVSCAGKSPPSTYYLLNSITESVEMPKEASDPQALKIGIGPIRLPKYLDRPQVVIRTADNEARMAEFERWAEPLGENFTRVMIENLAYLLNTVYLHPHPWPNRVSVDYQVRVHVYQFDVTAGKHAELFANWMVVSGDDRSILVQKNAVIRQSVDSKDTTKIVAALNATLDQFCREIAETIRSIDQDR